MATKIVVPQLGEGVEEVTILQWLTKEGDSVEEYDGLVEVETDKVVTEIPSPATGTVLKIVFPSEGSTVPVGTILAWIGEPGETISDTDIEPGEWEKEIPRPVTEAKAAPKPGEVPPVGEIVPENIPTEPGQIASSTTAIPAAQAGRDSKFGFISPVVAKISAENSVDLTQVIGTGLNRRITKKDILAYLDSLQKPPTPTAPRVKPAAMPGRKGGQGIVMPLSTIRKRIADHMVMSKRTSAHVTTLMEADMSRVVAHRSSNKEDFARDGTRLTFTAYFVAAAVEALKAFPLVNSSWRDEGILLHNEINIGMATDLGEEGLIVPVIKNADELSLLGIARAVNDLADRARSKKLSPSDVQAATFSITNHGVSGSLLATPIINQPQSAILGIGAIKKRVTVVLDEFSNDTIAIRPLVYLTLTFDHRILDGAGADHYLAKVVESLETWSSD
jgi:2-oxoisovalerate dehydrogenase E2 component (dihydrolipoyl transacylase)